MLRVLGLVALFVVLGCKGVPERTCTSDNGCLQEGVAGRCLLAPSAGERHCAYPQTGCPSGFAWGILAGDGLAEACVDDLPAVDAGSDGAVDAPPGDGATADAMPDAAPVDASGSIVDAGSPDAPPLISPVTTGQAADLVLGQTTFTGTTGDNTSPGFGVLYWPWGVVSDGAHLWVADAGNARVLQWDGLPLANGQLANLVIGQPGTGWNTSGTTQARISAGDVRVFTDGTRIYVADSTNNRVLIWNTIPAASGANASVVLGQANFTTATSGNGASAMAYPIGLWSDGTRLVVADTSNNRVLIWNSIPTTNGDAADVVLGQSGFGMSGTGAITASSLAGPRDVFYDGAHLFVADTGRNRVLAWNGIPTTNGDAADYVIGQSGFTTGGMNASSPSTNAAGFYQPVGLLVDRGSLFVADNENHRVLVFTPTPTATGAVASVVLGQPDLTSGGMGVTSETTIAGPGGLASDGNHLWVTDFDWHRVLRYTLSP